MDKIASCPTCGLPDGFHDEEACGHLDPERAGWEYVGSKYPETDQYEHRWYQETDEGRTGICHVVRVLKPSGWSR